MCSHTGFLCIIRLQKSGKDVFIWQLSFNWLTSLKGRTQTFVGNPLVIPSIVVFAILSSDLQAKVSRLIHHCISIVLFLKPRSGGFGYGEMYRNPATEGPMTCVFNGHFYSLQSVLNQLNQNSSCSLWSLRVLMATLMFQGPQSSNQCKGFVVFGFYYGTYNPGKNGLKQGLNANELHQLLGPWYTWVKIWICKKKKNIICSPNLFFLHFQLL